MVRTTAETTKMDGTATTTSPQTLAAPFEEQVMPAESTPPITGTSQQQDQQDEQEPQASTMDEETTANMFDSSSPPAFPSETDNTPSPTESAAIGITQETPMDANKGNSGDQPKPQAAFLRSFRRKNENKRIPKDLLNDQSSDMTLYEKESDLRSSEQKILKYIMDNAPTSEEIAEAGMKTAKAVGGFAVEAKPYVEAGLGLAWKAIGESYKLASQAVTKAQEEYQQSSRKAARAPPIGIPSSKRLIKKLPVVPSSVDVQVPMDAEFQKSPVEPQDPTPENQEQPIISESSQPVVSEQPTNENTNADIIAANYIQTIQDRYAGKPEVYDEFVSILRMYQQQQLAIPEVVRRVSALFAKQPDLIRKFAFFLPEATELLEVFAEEAEANLAETSDATINGIPLSSLGNDWSDPPSGEVEESSVSEDTRGRLGSNPAWSPIRSDSPTLQMGETNKSRQSTKPAWSPRGQDPVHQVSADDSTGSSVPRSTSIDQLAQQWASEAGRSQGVEQIHSRTTPKSSSADQLAREWSQRNHDEESAFPNESKPVTPSSPSMEELASQWSSVNSDKDNL